MLKCPRCREGTGRPDGYAIHEGDTVRLIVRCSECRHRWSVIRQATDPGVEPNPAA